jgi:hypothetical protein
MPERQYVGAIDEVDVVGIGTFKRGDVLEVTAEQAKALDAQPDNFKTPAKKKG